jgi:hypothetical protein
MNIPSNLKLILCAALLAAPLVLAAADQPATPKDKAPHGGRLMDGATVRVEFLVKADQTVEVYLYDLKLKPVAPADQTVSLILQGKDGAKTKIDLGKGTEAFASATPVAFLDGARAILTVKAGGKPENFRFDPVMGPCRGCKKPEYACDCDCAR